jgi:hypothetical protein
MSLDLAAPIRNALIGNGPLCALLALWNGEPAIFTRRPVPGDAAYPFILVSPDISIGDEDGLKSLRPTPRRDIGIYGLQPDDYRKVEAAGYLIRTQFHKQRFAVEIPGYRVVQISVTGPMAAPVDNANEVGRACLLRFRLKDLST